MVSPPAPCRPRPPRCVCAVAGPSAAARCRRNCRSSGLRPHSQRGTTKQVGHSGWVSIVVSAAARTAGVREQRRRHCPRPLHHSGPALSARFGAQSPRRSSPASMHSHRSAASWRRPVYRRHRGDDRFIGGRVFTGENLDSPYVTYMSVQFLASCAGRQSCMHHAPYTAGRQSCMHHAPYTAVDRGRARGAARGRPGVHARSWGCRPLSKTRRLDAGVGLDPS
eukprot:SAG22_NODE_4382_length_1286_cov_1.868576_1_plen_222_part_01